MTAASPPSTRFAPRAAIALAVLAGHILVVIALVAGFAPDLGRRVVSAALTAVAITTPPPPPPPPPRHHAPAHHPGAAPKSPARPAPRPPAPVALPPAPIVLAPPIAAGGGAGQGTGPGGSGGSGSGNGGTGQGSGPADTGPPVDPVKTAGGINLDTDYPAQTRALRSGDFVVVQIAVGADGLPTACTVTRPGRDPDAGPLTCRLVLARFRFRPAHDGQGRAVPGSFGWKQVWKPAR